ncbi:MAG: flagellar biosynthesis protein [Clostridiales bacterium]|jgi:flagellar operon protein|nr:flagellar biosynthesis protein [Clostridiales bacterium]
MANEINNFKLNDSIIRQAERLNQANKARALGEPVKPEKSFQEILDQKIRSNSITFSKHANLRTIERNIEVTQMDLDRLGDACEKVREKGIRDALIVMNDSAFIVNAPNRTVITVVDKDEMKSNIFTNIDGALFI